MTLRARVNRILLTSLMAITLASISLTAFAQETEAESTPESVAETDTGTVKIPISQDWNLNGVDADILHDEDMTVHYAIVQEADSYNDGKESVTPASFDLTYEDNTQEITFTAEHAGVYTYLLTAETNTAAGYTYDTTTYTIRHYVKNTANGGLETFLTAENMDGKKVSKVAYNHVFTSDTTIDPPHKKSSDGGTPEKGDATAEAVITGQDVDHAVPDTDVSPDTVVDHQNQYTGDASHMMRNAVIMGMAVILLIAWIACERKRTHRAS